MHKLAIKYTINYQALFELHEIMYYCLSCKRLKSKTFLKYDDATLKCLLYRNICLSSQSYDK